MRGGLLRQPLHDRRGLPVGSVPIQVSAEMPGRQEVSGRLVNRRQRGLTEIPQVHPGQAARSGAFPLLTSSALKFRSDSHS